MGLSEAGMKIVQALAEMPEVIKIARAPNLKLTQDHYGHYASVISALGKATGRERTKEGHYLAAEALKLAGGNVKGIDSAMFAFFGYSDYDPLQAMFG